MVTGFDDVGPAPAAAQPSAAAEPNAASAGWTFDEDISWGYDDTPASTIDAPAPVTPAVAAEPPTPAAPPVAAVTPPPTPAPTPVAHPARMVLGLASLAAERIRGGAPGGEMIVTGVGLMQETAARARGIARRVLEPASQAAMDTMELTFGAASRIPVAGAPLRGLSKSKERLTQALADARTRGRATVAAGRADAEAFVRVNIAETMSWAQAQAVPQIVDGLVPHLVDEVVPRILEGTLPEIRATVLPAVIDDLTNSPQVRDLVLEQGRGVVGDAAEHLRTTTAAADDRVESAFRRLVRAPAPTDQAPTDGG